jgi:hypothetical protein
MTNILVIPSSEVFVGSGFIPDHFSVGYKTPPYIGKKWPDMVATILYIGYKNYMTCYIEIIKIG